MVVENRLGASGIKTLPELIQLAKAKPDDITCGTSGQAGVQHFACVMIARALGINLRSVHYKGGGAALLDAASGDTKDFANTGLNSINPWLP